jgi:hypothetical protein
MAGWAGRWWRDVDRVNVVGRVLLARQLDLRLRVHDDVQYPIVFVDQFWRIGMHGEMGIKSLPLRNFLRFAINDGCEERSWSARPLADRYAPLAFGLQLSEKGNALRSANARPNRRPCLASPRRVPRC